MPLPLRTTTTQGARWTAVFEWVASATDDTPTADFDGASAALELRPYAEAEAVLRLTTDTGGGLSLSGHRIIIDVDALTMEAVPGGVYGKADLVVTPGGDPEAAYVALPMLVTVAPAGTLRSGSAVSVFSGSAPSTGPSASVYRIIEGDTTRVVTGSLSPLAVDVAAGLSTLGLLSDSAPRRLYIWSAAPTSPTTYASFAAAYAAALALSPTEEAPVSIVFLESLVPDSVDADALESAHIYVSGIGGAAGREVTAKLDAILYGRWSAEAIDIDADGLRLPISGHLATVEGVEAMHPTREETTALVASAVSGAVTALVGAAPTTLDTIGELATEFAANDTILDAVVVSLAGKASTVHTHAQSEITNLVADLALKASAASVTALGTTVTALSRITLTTRTTSGSLASGDLLALVRYTNASALAVTIPSGLGWVAGDTCQIQQGGAGAVTVSAGSGVTVTVLGSAVTTGVGSARTVLCVGTNSYEVF